MQNVQTQIRRRKMWRLIRVFTVCLQHVLLNLNENELNIPPNIPKHRNGLAQLIMVGDFNRLKWVKFTFAFNRCQKQMKTRFWWRPLTSGLHIPLTPSPTAMIFWKTLSISLQRYGRAIWTSTLQRHLQVSIWDPVRSWGTQWLSSRVLDSRPRGREFEPHRRLVVLEQDTFILA